MDKPESPRKYETNKIRVSNELTVIRAERDRFKRMYEDLIATGLEELLKERRRAKL